MKLLKNKKGVTLAELLAVITIMGIIAAIAVPAISNAISRSNEEAAKGDAIAIFEGASIYCRVSNACPSTTTVENHTTADPHPVQSYVDRLRSDVEYSITFENGAPILVTVDLGTGDPAYQVGIYDYATFNGQTAELLDS